MKITMDNFIKQFKKGKEAALEFVIDEYIGIVKAVVYHSFTMYKDQQMIEECVSDTFLGAFENARQFKGDEEDFKRWLCAIAKFKAIDKQRKLSSHPRFSQIDDKQHAVLSAEEEYFTKKSTEELLDMMRKLTPLDQDIFTMKYFLNMKNNDIASALGLTKMNKQLNRMLQGRGLEKKSKVKETSSLILRNILYYRKRIFPTFLQILIVSSLVSVVYLSLTESVSQSNHTVLGQYINAGVNDWNQLILYSTFILTIITLIESISAMLIARKEEIHTFKILGWNLSSINRIYMKEISLWSGIALAMGSVLSFLLFFSFYPVNLQNVLFILLTAIGLYLIIFMVASIILKQRLKQSYA